MTLEDEARLIVNEAVLIDKVEFSDVEINLYRLQETPIEIWFNAQTEEIKSIKYIRNKRINPYLKFINKLIYN